MMNEVNLPSIEDLKLQAKRLRAGLAARGTAVSHSEALELLASQHGFADWNVLSAQAPAAVQACVSADEMRAEAAAPQPGDGPPVVLGEQVTGRYLGQPFVGRVVGLSEMAGGGHYRVSLQFDDPVDVVAFDSFSSLRQRVTGVVDLSGVSPSKTSNGVPQLEVVRVATAR